MTPGHEMNYPHGESSTPYAKKASSSLQNVTLSFVLNLKADYNPNITLCFMFWNINMICIQAYHVVKKRIQFDRILMSAFNHLRFYSHSLSSLPYRITIAECIFRERAKRSFPRNAQNAYERARSLNTCVFS